MARAMRPLLAFPFPRRWKLFAWLVNNPRHADHWTGERLRWTRCKNTSFVIPCDVSVFSGRIAWYFRRWYEIDTQSAIISLLPENGTFIDIGANCGMASLSAASAVGPGGRIIAFEPNPAIAAINQAAMSRNGLQSVVTLHNAAIADRNGEMDLYIPASNHGEASLATDFRDRAGQKVSVRVSDGSELAALDCIDLVKIDVEGFELTVVKSIAPTLERLKPFVISEVMDEHLSRAGTSSSELANFMATIDYVGFALTYEDAGLLRQSAKLAPFAPGGKPADGNVIWSHKDRAEELLATRFAALRK